MSSVFAVGEANGLWRAEAGISSDLLCTPWPVSRLGDAGGGRRLLRCRAAGEPVNQADIDWPNVAEEIEALGKDEKRELASKISTIMEHLLKLEAPGLRRTVPAVIAEELGGARTEAAASLADNSETPRIIIDAVVHSENQMLGDWQP